MMIYELNGKKYRVVIETKYAITLQNLEDKSDIIVSTKPLKYKERYIDIESKESKSVNNLKERV